MLSTAKAEAYRLLIGDVYELAGASRRTSTQTAAAAGLGVAGWHLLSVLEEAPLPVPAAAARLGQSRQAVQRVADVLLAQGHLERKDNPGHTRSPLLALTDHGRSALETVLAASDTRRDQQLHDLTAEDLVAARTVLRRVLTAITDEDHASR